MRVTDRRPVRQARLGLNARSLSPEQRLAGAVLAQAVADSRNRSYDERRRRGASAFLQGADLMAFWCSVAGLDPDVVRQKARRLHVGHAPAETFEP
jgi:hypothetical protein